jgi:superfamily II DNA or RNA helicase
MVTTPDWKSIPLWPHQARAVEQVLEYLEAYPPEQGRAALIKMPTGTGKSGVMAVLARAVPQLRNVLVLAPWASIASQLIDDIRERFWSHLKAPYNDPSPWPREVVELLPSTIEKHLRRRDTALAMVGTIQSLEWIAREKPRVYGRLCERVQLVCFDEGHREPAPSWSEAIRQLDRPTVLFSATPYRNDHKIFDFSPDFMFSLSHRAAETARYIRELVVHPLPAFDGELQFIEALLATYKEKFGVEPRGETAPRVIVRCETSMEVRNVQEALRGRGFDAVAMHDSFAHEPEALRFKSVARARKSAADAVFWVHQFKLLEGFDDSRCQMLALYGDLDSTRALVQQIGRVLRNPRRRGGEKAYLLCRAESTALKEWLSYRRWDAAFEANRAILDGSHAFKKILDVHLDEQYFENHFRRKLDLDAADLEQRIRYRRSSVVREIGSRKFDLDDAAHFTLRAWHTIDLSVIRYLAPDANTRILLYVSFGNSELFPEDYVLEYRLAYTVLRRGSSDCSGRTRRD